MITELIQTILNTIKQTFFCWHKWEIVIRKDNGADFWICKKCEYLKSF